MERLMELIERKFLKDVELLGIRRHRKCNRMQNDTAI